MKANSAVRSLIKWFPYVGILVVWLLLYLPHLRMAPGWYIDEGLHYGIAQSLLRGEIANQAVAYTFLKVSGQPLVLLWMDLGGLLFGGDILGGRLMNTLLALMLAGVLYSGTRKVWGRWIALSAALIFLSSFQAVVHFRQCFPHNGVALGVGIALVALLSARNRALSEWKAGLGLMIACGSHALAIHAGLAAVLTRLFSPKSWVRLLLPGLLLGVCVYSVVAVLYGSWLLDDIFSIARNYSEDSSKAEGRFLLNGYSFFTQDIFQVVAVVGWILAFSRRLYPIAIFGFVMSALLLNNRSNLPVFYYQAIILQPVLALGWGVLLWRLWQLGAFVFELFPDVRRWRLGTRVGVPALVFLGLWWQQGTLADSLSGRIIPKNQYWVTQRSENIEACARWINKRVQKDDLVVAISTVALLLKDCQVATWMQVEAWNGGTVLYYYEGVPRERFFYDASLERARYAVISDIDVRWTVGLDGMKKWMDAVVKDWEVVWVSEFTTVYERPEGWRMLREDEASGKAEQSPQEEAKGEASASEAGAGEGGGEEKPAR